MMLPKLWVYPVGSLLVAIMVFAYIYTSDRLSDSGGQTE